MIEFNPELTSAAAGWRRASALAENEGIPPYSVMPATFDQQAEILYVPLLTKQCCQRLIKEANACAIPFRESESDGRFAASELRLQQFSPQAERDLIVGLTQIVSPLVWKVWRMLPTVFSPPFIIKYQAGYACGLPPHHDFQSDVSFSVALNDGFSGGGLQFPRQRRHFDHKTVGSALLFPGKVTHLHTSADVQSGTRYVLTIWSKHAEENRA